MNVSDPETIFHYQGDQVLVTVDKQSFIFTIVVLVDVDHRELQLVNRQPKNWQAITFTQAVLDNLEPCKDKQAKWKLAL